MSIHVALNHVTHYRYERPIRLGPQTVRLRPAAHCRTPILNYSLHITPEKHFLNWQQDPLGNFQARLVFPEKTDEFKVEIDLTADMAKINPFDFFLEEGFDQFPFSYDAISAHELKPYLELENLGDNLRRFLEKIPRSPRKTIDFLVDLNGLIKNEIAYVVRLEPGVQSCEDTLALKSGSCRDSAWLLVQICRQLGLAARFVSGYLIQLTSDIKPLGDGAAGPENDFTDLHAWTEVYLPGAGWVGLDGTSGMLCGEGHIPLAATSDPVSAAAITGDHEPGKVDFDFHMQVTRIFETPRVTAPYKEAQWREIEALGRRVDEELTTRDVRLTMGGEPTFVSTIHRDGVEWNYTALSPEKQEKGELLLRRLQAKYAADGSLLHFGQGKWYPGESLPRWAYGCYWRKDGRPLWKNDALCARTGTDYQVTTKESGRFLAKLAEWLHLDAKFVREAYEDVYHYLFEEARLPLQCFVARRQGQVARGARAADPRLPAGARHGNRPHAARASRLRGLAARLALVGVASARRAADADPGRFADGLSPAAGLAPLGHRGREHPGGPEGSDRAPTAAPDRGGDPPRAAAPRKQLGLEHSFRRLRSRAGGAARQPGRAHRDLRPAPRRHPPHFHAADGDRGRLSRTAFRGGENRRRARAAGCGSRAMRRPPITGWKTSRSRLTPA